jgi:beta-lactamase regulating signal transducer with metallopeptidase domain
VDDILNWLWQGCVVALATMAMLRAPGLSPARIRYRVCWMSLLVVVMLPAVPILWAAVSPSLVLSRNGAARVVPLVSMPEGWWTSSSVVIVLWTLWCSALTCRLAASILALRQAKARARPVPTELEARLRCWAQVRAQGRRTRLVASDRVRAAAVLGVGTPIIAVAPRLLDQLTDEELDRVVIHEWAHVQRRDDVANLVQLLARVVAGWHPAVRWIDRQLQIEREVACDETAVFVTGSAKRYAACLTKLASLPYEPLGPLPAPGALSSSDLRIRVGRILALGRGTPSTRSTRAALGALVLLWPLALTVGALRIIDIPRGGIVLPLVPVNAVASQGVEAHRPIQGRSSTGPAVVPRSVSRVRSMPPSARLAPAPAGTLPPSTGPVPRDSSSSVRDGQQTPAAVHFESLLAPAPPASERLLDSTSHGFVISQIPGDRVKTPSPWDAAAGAAVAAGRSSQRAARATGDFFSRFGKSVAGSF